MKNEYSFFDKYVLLNWNNTTGQPLMVGSAFHYALEQFYILQGEGKTLTKQEVLKIATDKLSDEIEANEQAGLKEFVSSKLGPDGVIAFESVEHPDDVHYTEARETHLLANAITQEEIDEAKRMFIDWGKTQSPASALAEIEVLVENYFTRTPYTAQQVLHVEANETAHITDLEGEVMPMPMKGKMDLIIRDEEGKIVVIDHKTAK